MQSFCRMASFLVLLCCLLGQPLAAATAEAEARAEVVSVITMCHPTDDECSRFGVRMSATLPEVIKSPDTVVKFDIIADNHSCSIILPPKLNLHDSAGRKVASCSFSSSLGHRNPNSGIVGVVIKAEVHPLEMTSEPIEAKFDVVVAYD